jgi:hypothetical protein
MPKEREVTRIYKWKSFTSRPIGRPKNRWEDDVRNDLQTMKITHWKKSVLNRDLWKIIVERTKTHIRVVASIKKKYTGKYERFGESTASTFHPEG